MAIQEAVPGRLGSYRLLDRIGEGGMGVVHLAVDPANQLVAVKVLRTQDARDKTARRRLEREVASMCRVRSRFVPEVLDADVQGDVPYFVTRFVSGRNLGQVVAGAGPLAGAPLQRLAYGLAEALAAAHAVGVVHRDLKPANVIMNGDDPLVIDFGIAELPDTSPLTRTGIIIGTPGYLAPEIIEGRSYQPPSDVHSWAATVGFAARGKPVYGTGPYEAVLSRILRGDADLTGIPGPLYPLVAAALLRQPAQRPSASWLASQVALLDLTAPGPPPTVTACPPETLAAIAPPQPTAPVPPNLADPLPLVIPAPDLARKMPARETATPGRAIAPVHPWRPARRRVLGCIAVLTAAAISFKLPAAGTAGVVAVLAMLRTAGYAREALAARRRWRGPSRTDHLRLAASLPWALTRSLLIVIASSPLLLLIASLPGAALLLSLGRSQLPMAVASCAGAFTVLNCAAPTTRVARREWNRLMSAVTTTWPARTATALLLAAIAAATVLSGLANGPAWWPSPNPYRLLHLAQAHRLTGAPAVPGRPRPSAPSGRQGAGM